MDKNKIAMQWTKNVDYREYYSLKNCLEIDLCRIRHYNKWTVIFDCEDLAFKRHPQFSTSDEAKSWAEEKLKKYGYCFKFSSMK